MPIACGGNAVQAVKMSPQEEKKHHSIEFESPRVGKFKLATTNAYLAFAGLALVGVMGAVALNSSWRHSSSESSSTAQQTSPATAPNNVPKYQPSAIHTAGLLSKAVNKYRGALGMAYTAALGGAYVPVISYELMLDDLMLTTVADLNLLSTIPGVRSIPAEEDPHSIGYGICEGIRSGNAIVEQVTAQYNTKLPEILFADVDRVRTTTLHKYFIRYAEGKSCDVFLGALRNERERRDGTQQPGRIAGHPIPYPEAKFSKDEFRAYVAAVQAMENDVMAIIGAAPH